MNHKAFGNFLNEGGPQRYAFERTPQGLLHLKIAAGQTTLGEKKRGQRGVRSFFFFFAF